MRDISALVEAAIESSESKMFYLLELQFGVILRYTDCDIDLYKETTASGIYDKFDSMPFSFNNVNYGTGASVDKLRIDIQNVDLTMSATLLNEDTMNKWGILWMVFYDDDNKQIEDPIELFRGLVSTWSLKELRCNITLVNEFVFWNKKTLRKYQSACRWQFKGTECNYSGIATNCDQGYANCEALSNSDNFGGFRWLPELMEKEIYWGKTT